MNTNRKTAIIVGVLFLTATVTFMLGDDALTGSILDDPDYLVSVSKNRTKVIMGMLIAFIDGIAIVGIAVLLFPILKKHNEPIALGYVGLRITEFAVIIAYLISPLVLITLSQEYVKAGDPDASYFQTLGTLFQAGRYWAIQLVYIFNGLAGLMLAYLLYQSKLIPRSISVLGLIGYALLLPGALLDMFGYVDTLHGAGMIVFLPGALFEILLPIWLIVKGFNSSAIDSGSAKTDINEV
jgi:amino acid permease